MIVATWHDRYCCSTTGTKVRVRGIHLYTAVTKDRQHAEVWPLLLFCPRNNAARCSPDEVQAGAEAEARATDISSVRRNERSKEDDVDRRFQCSHVLCALPLAIALVVLSLSVGRILLCCIVSTLTGLTVKSVLVVVLHAIKRWETRHGTVKTNLNGLIPMYTGVYGH